MEKSKEIWYPTITDVSGQICAEAVTFKVKKINPLLRGDDPSKSYSSIVTIEIISMFVDGKEIVASGKYTVDVITGAELEVEKNYSTETGIIKLIPQEK